MQDFTNMSLDELEALAMNLMRQYVKQITEVTILDGQNMQQQGAGQTNK
jgi:hypothetical protein